MSHLCLFLFLVFLCFFIPTVTSLDKVTVFSLLDDSNSLLIGLIAPKCSFSTLFHNMARSILPNHKCHQVIVLLLKAGYHAYVTAHGLGL